MEEAANDGNSYFMEVHDRINSVDVVLRGSDHPSVIEVRPHNIVSRRIDGAEDTYPLAIPVEPHSVSSVKKHPNEGVGMRFQIQGNDNEPETCCLSTSLKRYSGELYQLEHGPCQCGCQTCGLSLFINNVKFSRVLPLPSQTWRDLFNNWTCCSHNHDGKESDKTKGVTPLLLRPREGDCLLSDLYIMVHCKIVDKRNVIFRRKTVPNEKAIWSVKCARCRAIVGEAVTFKDEKIGAYKLFKNSIEVLSLKVHQTDTIVRPIFFSEFFLERLLAQQFSTSVETHVTHMFIIRDTHKSINMLIRVINTSTRLYINSGKSPSSECCRDSATKRSFNKENLDAGSAAHHRVHWVHSGGGGGGDANNSSFKSPRSVVNGGGGGASKTGGGEGSKIVKDGPPRLHGCKVAEVIEKLFSFSTHLISIGRTCNEVKNADPTGCERIVKVMYASTARPAIQKLAATWMADERTLTLVYPAHICVQMLLVLVSSTLTMPVAQRVIGDFVVGFLRLD